MKWKPVVRATRNQKVFIAHRAEDVAQEYGWLFTGLVQANEPAAYTAEFVAHGEEFDGYAICNENGEYDFVFGPDQMIFGGDDVTTEEDYYGVIGAGI